MRRSFHILAVAMALGLMPSLFGVTSSDAAPSRKVASLPPATEPALTGGDSRPPYGWVEFCRHHPGECQKDVNEASVIEMSPQVWRTLNAVNSQINNEIRPITDIDQWGMVEKWSFPETGRGDCEDYALLKRRQLAERGIPRRAMLMTVVIDETGGGHAILMVRTNRGDMILDNKRATVMPWSETGYRYVKRESQASNGWVGMSDPGASAVATAAR